MKSSSRWQGQPHSPRGVAADRATQARRRGPCRPIRPWFAAKCLLSMHDRRPPEPNPGNGRATSQQRLAAEPPAIRRSGGSRWPWHEGKHLVQHPHRVARQLSALLAPLAHSSRWTAFGSSCAPIAPPARAGRVGMAMRANGSTISGTKQESEAGTARATRSPCFSPAVAVASVRMPRTGRASRIWDQSRHRCRQRSRGGRRVLPGFSGVFTNGRIAPIGHAPVCAAFARRTARAAVLNCPGPRWARISP